MHNLTLIGRAANTTLDPAIGCGTVASTNDYDPLDRRLLNVGETPVESRDTHLDNLATQDSMITIFSIRPKAFNVGNDAIFRGLQHLLKRTFGAAVNLIQLPATAQYESIAQAGLSKRTVHAINQYGHGVIIGGGNLYENGELEIDANALSALEPPLLIFSLSMGRIYNRRGELVRRTDAMRNELATEINLRAKYSLARDEATLQYLHGLGMDHVRLGGCPTTMLDEVPLRDQTSAHDRGVTWISIRTPELMSVPLHYRAKVPDEVRDIIELLRKHGHQDVRLLCHDHRDIPFAASFSGVEYAYTADVDDYLALLRHCRLTVTYRLHSALPCVAFGRPFIKLSYDERGLSMFKTLGLDEWNINAVTGDAASAVRDRLSRLPEFPRILERASPQIATLHETINDTFAAFAEEVRAYSSGTL
jgi:polysaccharide pyruvyl transferase WcaK-like protein